MGASSDKSTQEEHNSLHQVRPDWSIRLTPRGLGTLFLINLIVISVLAWPLVSTKVNPPQPSAPPTGQALAVEHVTSATLEPTETENPPTPSPTASTTPDVLNQSHFSDSPINQGTIFLALSEGAYSQLFAFQPANRPLTRLTNGPWDDITPSLSPDHRQIAFSSNRDGQWDLYLLDLITADLTRLTDTPEYDAAPHFSPDGQYIVHESYIEGNLEIMIQAINNSELEPINLSKHPGVDFAPSWSPKGRQIAFVSTRSGDPEIWIANLDKGEEERFINISQSSRSKEAHPIWSPDGGALAWASLRDGIHSIYIWYENGETVYAGSGDWPVWGPDGRTLLIMLNAPNQTLLTAQTAHDALMILPPVILPGSTEGLSWGSSPLPSPLPMRLAQVAEFTPTPLWLPELTPAADIPGNRHKLILLNDVEAPYPQLHDLVDESFKALRDRVGLEAGWDFLASLENAYVPLTAPLAPGLGNDWLYTGRAFAITPLPINAGWVVVIPEKFGSQTFWRIYLKARIQDGSRGRPLYAFPWDLNGRYNGNQSAYEDGGAQFESIPVGYWVDFTELASAYGWERLPALPNWQSSFPATRFNEFVLSDSQDWHSAMLELYPAEALVTPTVMLPPTLTPTPTPRWYRTPTPTNTATPIPTLTPLVPTQMPTTAPGL